MKIDQLRKRHSIFCYHSFESKLVKNNLHISFLFQTEPDILFRPEIIIENINQSQIDRLGSTFNNLVFHLGLAEIPSYWKATCSPKIIIKAGYPNLEQIKFWHKLLIKGLGQFFYENKVDFTGKNFVEIKNFYKVGKEIFLRAPRQFLHTGCGVAPQSNVAGTFDVPPAAHTRCDPLARRQYLIPLGGGKDSIVTIEILKEAGLKTNLFILNPVQTTNSLKTTLKIAKTAGYKNPIIVRRKIDPQLFELNNQGYLNGHVPITAYISFLSLLVAALNDYNQIVFSNERSSNEANLYWKGAEINHQYSKSLEFENDFRQYSQKYITPKINYFSFLRPLYELQISKIFTQYPKYFAIFRSCNVGFKKGVWCGRCPKCLSVFLLLSPFLSEKKLTQIFAHNLFEEKSLLPTLKQLLGEQKHKPFECVGTIEENQAAAWLTIQQTPLPLPPLLLTAKRYLKSLKYNQKRADKILNSWNESHNLPRNLEKILKMAHILKEEIYAGNLPKANTRC